MNSSCEHLDHIQPANAKAVGCEECLLKGDDWVHLRLCLTCGHVGCCDDSPNQHATNHFHETQHPVVESLEPDEAWRWCYVDQILFQMQITIDDEATTTETGVLAGLNLGSRRTLSVLPEKRGFNSICQRVRRCNKKNLEPTIELAVEIAREGREGRRIGTLFTFGDSDAVLTQSRPLILDPLAGHPDNAKHITDQNLRGTIKELAQLDGAFVISNEGIVVSACRYLDAVASDVVLPYGMASRHLAAASISQSTDTVAIVVSESSMVRVFDDGKLVAEIIPELWLMDHYNVKLPGPYQGELVGDFAVLTADK